MPATSPTDTYASADARAAVHDAPEAVNPEPTLLDQARAIQAHLAQTPIGQIDRMHHLEVAVNKLAMLLVTALTPGARATEENRHAG